MNKGNKKLPIATHTPNLRVQKKMNKKLLLVNSITLLFRESQITGSYDNSTDLVRKIIQSVDVPETTVGFDNDRDILQNLKTTALHMCENPPEHKYELQELLQRLKVNTLEEESLYEAFCDGMMTELSPEVLRRTCLNMKRSLNNYFREETVKNIINKSQYDLKFGRNKITDLRAYINNHVAQLEPYLVDVEKKDPAVISDVCMSNKEAVTQIFDDVKKVTTGTTVLQTGFQGLNRMLDGGFRRGEQTSIGALQHNYKTGLSLTLFKQVALYNKPVLTDPTKKPCLLRISFEDSLALNFQFLYLNLWENETGQRPDITNVSPEEMAAYVMEKLGVNGYHTRFMFVNPSMWTYKDICNKVIELESEGFEVHMVMVDYLLKLPTAGCDQGPSGHDIRNMYERIRNFMAARNIAFVTPHQLSTDAKMMIREGRTGFVKELIGKGYYAGSKQIDQVVDLEIFVHIETVNNKAYLTIQRGKHRKIEQTPLEHLYCALPFNGSGSILDDINGPDTTRKKVGGGAIGSGEETPFWETTD